MNLANFLKNPIGYFKKANQVITNKLQATFYKGDKVICELCGWQGQRFFKARCPNCRSLERTRLIPYACEYFDLMKENLKILHISPNQSEYNFVSTRFKNYSVYDRLDINPIKNVNIVDDITKTKLATNTYDLIITWHVLEHIKEDEKAIQEMYRILRKTGKLLVSVPMHPAFNETTYEDDSIPRKDYQKVHGHPDHCRSCGHDYYERFEKHGFVTNELFVNTINEEIKNKYGLRNDHIVWCFNKNE